ncbi:MAG TPA: TIGR01777 family oxidoreductase [Pirellulales bacterium]|nr:TIGR01777 family oxidoreductase [Pirellulales bacterium]
MRALLTGATGFIGQHLLKRLDRPVVLSRNADKARQALAKFNVQTYSWNPLAGPPPLEAFEGVDAVFHLAGESVASGRWTAEKKRLIRESRELGTRHFVQTLQQLKNRPRVLVSASATGWYGDRGDEVLEESAPPADDFLGEVCVAWEREAQKATELGVRVACIRTGIALGLDGGALKQLLPPFRFGLGGPLGSGKQWMPWIHVGDLAALFLHAAERSAVTGPINAAAPNAVTNKQFTKALGAAVHRPAILPVPYYALRLALGEFAQVLFDSQRVIPRAAQASGFQFSYPEIGPALDAIVSVA